MRDTGQPAFGQLPAKQPGGTGAALRVSVCEVQDAPNCAKVRSQGERWHRFAIVEQRLVENLKPRLSRSAAPKLGVLRPVKQRLLRIRIRPEPRRSCGDRGVNERVPRREAPSLRSLDVSTPDHSRTLIDRVTSSTEDGLLNTRVQEFNLPLQPDRVHHIVSVHARKERRSRLPNHLIQPRRQAPGATINEHPHPRVRNA